MFEKLWTIGLFVFVFHFVCRTLYGPYAFLQTVNKHPHTRPLYLSGKNKHFFGTQVQRESLWVPLAQVQKLVTFPLDSQIFRQKLQTLVVIKTKISIHQKKVLGELWQPLVVAKSVDAKVTCIFFSIEILIEWKWNCRYYFWTTHDFLPLHQTTSGEAHTFNFMISVFRDGQLCICDFYSAKILLSTKVISFKSSILRYSRWSP